MDVIGASLKRKEDRALVAGGGRFLDDLTLPGMLHLGVVRSTHAHARLGKVALSDALARDKVRYVGEPIAAVVADDPYRLADALEAVRIEYDWTYS